MEAVGSGEGEVRFAVNETLAGEPEWMERIFIQGASSLSEAELQLVLSGKKVQLDLRTLRQMEPHELARHFGHRGAARICAALELVRRTLEPPPRTPLTFAQDVYRYVWPKLAGAPRETLMVLCLDPRNHLLREAVAMQGSSDGCPVDPREVFAPAIVSRATSIVLAHNHPSGDPEPSVADWVLTKQLAEGARALRVKLADHIVLSERGFVSMQSRGLFAESAPFSRGGRDGG
jgi:DNA repair protein RadC